MSKSANLPFIWPLTSTTSCTIMQAVIAHADGTEVAWVGFTPIHGMSMDFTQNSVQSKWSFHIFCHVA